MSNGNVIVGAKVNLDTTPLFADTLGVELGSKTLMFSSVRDGVYQGYPFYKINLSMNGSAYSFNCSEDVYNACKSIAPATSIKIVLGLELRFKKIKVVSVEVA